MLLEVSSSTPMRSGKIGLAPEEANFLRHAVFENGEIALIEIGDESVVMVHHGDHEMDEVPW